MDLETHIRDCGLEPELIQLAKMRAFEINGCTFCLDMRSRDARRRGETEQRLYLLNAHQRPMATQVADTVTITQLRGDI